MADLDFDLVADAVAQHIASMLRATPNAENALPRSEGTLPLDEVSQAVVQRLATWGVIELPAATVSLEAQLATSKQIVRDGPTAESRGESVDSTLVISDSQLREIAARFKSRQVASRNELPIEEIQI